MLALWVGIALAGTAEDCRAANLSRAFPAMSAACAACAAEAGPRAGWCAERAAWVAARRDPDGGYAGVATLAAARAAPADPAMEQRIVALEADTHAGVVVRAEAALWLASRWAERDPAAAAAIASRWLDVALPPDVYRPLVQVASLSLVATGDVPAARALEQRVRVAPESRTRSPVEAAILARQVTTSAWVAAGIAGAWALAAAPLAVRVQPRFSWGFAAISLFGAVAWRIAESWDPGAGAALPWAVAGWAAIHGLSGAALQAEAPAAWRLGIRVGAGLATLAVGWLALYATDTVPQVLR